MDRQVHNNAAAAAMAFAQQQQQQANLQQQQQYGFRPQPQQYPQQVHGPPFLPPRPSLQQYAFPRPLQQQQQQQQIRPHVNPHHSLLHLQPQQPPPPAFPQLPPHIIPSPLLNPYDSAPPPVAAPPPDPEIHKRIDKLVEYAAKNGPEFEAMIREKQQDNPEYSFLFGGEGHNYYHYKLWLSTHPSSPAFNPSYPSSSMPVVPTNLNPLMNPSALNPPLNASGTSLGASPAIPGAPQMLQAPYPPYYDQQQHPQRYPGQSRVDYEPSAKPFKGLSGPLPSDVVAELTHVLNNLTGTKESIKGAKIWFMRRFPFAPALAEALKDSLFFR